MQEITSITSYPNQRMTLKLENNQGNIDFHLYYKPRIEAWFFDIEYNGNSINGLKVCLHPNILRQYRKIIPFGISFISSSKVEPFQLSAFSEKKVRLFLLNKDDVQNIEKNIYNE